jgi:gas vesicle protein
MARQDTTEFLTAFAVGAVLGIGATLLLRPEPKTAKERLMRELKPYRKRVRKSAGRMARELRKGRAATGEIADDAIDAGRELLGEFRDEVRRILSEARDELAEAMVERRGEERRTTERRKGERRGHGGPLRFRWGRDEEDEGDEG